MARQEQAQEQALNELISTLEGFQDKTDFYTILFYKSVGSTNDVARELLQGGGNGDNPSYCNIVTHSPCTVVIADHQSGGRGRFQRQWFSPPGVNIYMSIIIRDEMALALTDVSLINVVSSLAAIQAIKQCTTLEVSPQWPNDLYIRNKKIGGILSESVSMGERVISCITGIGINVNMTREEVPQYLQQRATSLLMETGLTYNRAQLICHILEAFRPLYERLINDHQGLVRQWSALNEMSNETPTETNAACR
ncbi:MAG: biotin--[acetyl-CoA-carboxylase] ligase [Nitrospirae bacterium]|nr:biotin--[acetyl-CoA-carboxylase] ligase [Nitrospirota bacterium]